MLPDGPKKEQSKMVHGPTWSTTHPCCYERERERERD